MAERPDLARALVRRWRREASGLSPRGEAMDLDPETRRALQQLGYVEPGEQ